MDPLDMREWASTLATTSGMVVRPAGEKADTQTTMRMLCNAGGGQWSCTVTENAQRPRARLAHLHMSLSHCFMSP